MSALVPGSGVQLSPTVVLAGTTMRAGPGFLGVTGQMALEFEVTWGRSSPLAFMEPPTAYLNVFDASGTWGTSREWIGERVDLSWTALAPYASAGSRVFFRGRVDDVVISRKAVQLANGDVLQGALVEFQLVSLLQELANIVPTVDFPGEIASARLARLGNYAAAQLPGSWASALFPNIDVGAIASKDQLSIWDQFIQIYDGMGGQRITYDPDQQGLWPINRRDFTARRASGRLTSKPAGTAGTARAGKGVYIEARSLRDPVAATQPRLYLDARALEYEPSDGIHRTPDSRITDVAVRALDVFTNGAWTEKTFTAAVPGVPAGLGSRTLRATVNVPGTSSSVAPTWAQLCAIDAAGWRPEPFQMRTDRASFEDVDQVVHLVRGGETDAVVFLESTYLPTLNLAPVFAIIGGKIAHRDGHWELEWQPAPIRLPAYQTSISCEAIDAGGTSTILLYDDENPSTFHESVSCEDLAYVGSSYGADDGTWVANDTEWNFRTA